MNLKINRSYIIFCGSFFYKNNLFNSKNVSKISTDYAPFFKRFPKEEIISFFSFIKSYYYKSFINNYFPEINYSADYLFNNLNENNYISETLSLKNPLHLTKKEIKNYSNLTLKNQRNNNKIRFNINYIDLYFYPGNIGIYAIKTSINDKDLTLEKISDFIFHFRTLDSGIIEEFNNISIKDFIKERIILENTLNEFIEGYNFYDKLKSYTVIESDFKCDAIEGKEYEDEVLYEIGTVSKIGTIKLNDNYSPSKEYFQKIISENKLSFFNNWSALSLFDTFTVLMNKIQDYKHSTFDNFENIYFPIYIHSLFLKYNLFKVNNELSSVSITNKNNQKTRDTFNEIFNKYNLSHVSYNFLANEIYKKIRSSMDIDCEINQMEEKIENINTIIDEKQENKTNIILGFLSFLSVGSALWDISEWISKIFGITDGLENFNIIYRTMSISLGIGIVTLLLIFLFLKKK
ncbi:MAG TPA: hypothetical protein PK385_06455 [Spirochaetota bacterium]|nr:hypothetical protein [Spirochaetota bacterium]HOS32272.1 hypothetical protein [Spirochaetota bacterium]HOS55683.1 hypothetical protein [Spirochaetota bacterium]HPK61361.1 hypothetical protein [Spirochaetota bacterium]HQF78068.1 hypothetical protein [Spirochaetota bacterium]